MSGQPEDPVDAQQALVRCWRDAGAGSYSISDRAERRLRVLGLALLDLKQILLTARRCVRLLDPTWQVVGSTLDGAEASVVVAFDERGVTVL